ncbi:hypothetical protein G6F57_021424 [Rhizopus arrhizus]|nr:hypothetical protein G6F57_021424 [Rhizopus arrhizus]
MAFHDFGNIQQLFLDLVEDVAGLGRQLDFQEDEQILAQCGRVDARMVTRDDAFALHALDAVRTRGGGQAHPIGQFGHRNAAFALQDIQDFQVDSV